ncbi:MAG: M20 family metallopeptidase [Tissierellaceae bacterium]|nr:M20 family metallopeptidase [Tissierellaceae bacterium]
MDNYKRAYEIKEDIIEYRRNIHSMAEVGFDLPNTSKYVKEKLIEFGYEPEEIIENGIVATVGKGGRTILLRADMDALPMNEESGLEFAAKNGISHTCGHDLHAAMLLGAAKLLKEQEDTLKGTVKFMFQPAEELLGGARKMIEAGVLENPKVDGAIMFHVYSTIPKGVVVVNTGVQAASNNNFKITVKGKGAHGAMPETGIDPIYIGAQIVIGLQELITREISYKNGAVLTTGNFEGGSAPNIIPDKAIIQGTMRTYDEDTQKYLVKRLPEIVKGIAETYRGTAEVEYLSDVPVLINDIEFSEEIINYIREFSQGRYNVEQGSAVTASEDFALVAKEVPGCMLVLGAADPNADTLYPLHNPKVTFGEDAMPLGTAIFVECATRWLKDNQ